VEGSRGSLLRGIFLERTVQVAGVSVVSSNSIEISFKIWARSLNHMGRFR